MLMVFNQTLSVCKVGIALTLLVGCVSSGPRANRWNPDAGGSVLASLDGISTEDQARDDLSYFLVCGETRESGSKIDKGGELFIRFTGASIKSDALCALEIRAPDNDSVNLDLYEWYGRKGGVEVKGLMYASNLSKPVNGKLDIKIYVLYAKKDLGDSVVVEARGQLELADNEQKPATMDAVQLECGAEFKQPGDYVPLSGNEFKLRFTLTTSDAQGKACERIAMRTKVNDQEFEWAATDVKIDLATPKKGDFLSFPPANTPPYLLRKQVKAADGDGILVNPMAGGPCINYVAAEGCQDRSVQNIPSLTSARNYVWLKVEGLTAAGARASYIVGAGERGFALYGDDVVNRDDLLQSIKDAAPQKWNWYDYATAQNGRSLPFDANFVSGESLKNSRIEVANLQSFTPLHIAETWLHGFYELNSLEALNKRSAARWYVTLSVKQGGTEVATLIVSDARPYFTSDSTIATLADGKRVFFDLESFRQKRSDANRGWSIYGTVGGTAVDRGCNLEPSDIAREFSRRHQGNFVASTGEAWIDSCKVTREKFDQTYGQGHSLEVSGIWVWGWHEVGEPES